MVKVFKLKPTLWTKHELQNPELGERNRTYHILDALLIAKRNNQSMPTLWWPLHTSLVLPYVNSMKVQLKFANIVRSVFPEAFTLSSDSVG